MLRPIGRYQRAADERTFQAQHSQHPEITQLWTSIAASWRFLAQREERLAAEEVERDARR